MIAWIKKLSWPMKLTIVFVIFLFLFMLLVLTPTGNNWMKSRIDDAYDQTPESERQDSPWADRYLSLAWWNANIRDTKTGKEMYKEFIGITSLEQNPELLKVGNMFSGKCSADGKTGWGPMHPRAPEAYYDYLQIYEIENSGQLTAARCWEYYYLFYDWMKKNSPDHKPHPKFKKYWEKIKVIAFKFHGERPNIDMSAREAPQIAADE